MNWKDLSGQLLLDPRGEDRRVLGGPIPSMDGDSAGFVDADPSVVVLQDGDAGPRLFGSGKAVDASKAISGQGAPNKLLHFEKGLQE